MIYETRVKSIILDKLSLYYMGLRPIFNEIVILESMPDFRTSSFQWINIVNVYQFFLIVLKEVLECSDFAM